jgi:hypothetical protein
VTAVADAAASSPERDPRIEGVLLDAEQFYTGQLAVSWAPAYLRNRGITAEAMGEWHIGYAPAGWTALTSYLRGRGHQDDAIQAAGLARISSRGTLIDHFRDRVMLPAARCGTPRPRPGQLVTRRYFGWVAVDGAGRGRHHSPQRTGPALSRHPSGPHLQRAAQCRLAFVRRYADRVS